MSAAAVALFCGIGVAAWIYNQFRHRTNSTKTSLVTAAVVGLMAFIVLFTLLHFIFGK